MKPQEIELFSEPAKDWIKKITTWHLNAALPAGLNLPDGSVVLPQNNGAQVDYGDKNLAAMNEPRFSFGKAEVQKVHPGADMIYVRQTPQGEIISWEFKVFATDNVKRSEFVPAKLDLQFPAGKAVEFINLVMASPGILKSVLGIKFPDIGTKIDVQNNSELIKIEPDIDVKNHAQKFIVARY